MVQSVSKKTRALYELAVERSNGIPVTMTCTNADADYTIDRSEGESEHTVQIGFDYEFKTLDPGEGLAEIIVQDLPFLEFAILYYVAEATGVKDCEIETQNVQLFEDFQADYARPLAVPESKVDIISLSSVSRDEWDEDAPACTFLIIDESEICIPLEGKMQATYIGKVKDEQAVLNYLKYHIERVINGDDILRNGVTGALFLDSRPLPPEPIIAPDVQDTREIGDSSRGYVALASSLSAAAAVVFLVLFFAFARRRRNKNAEEPEQNVIIASKAVAVDNSNDVQPAAIPVPTKRIGKDVEPDEEKGESSNHSEEEKGELSSEMEDAPISNDNEVPSVDPIISAIALINSRTTSLTVAETIESSEDTIHDDETEVVKNLSKEKPVPPPAVIDILPPKPPTAPSTKPPLIVPVAPKPIKQRRRRRKKKKKKTPMIRTNSRDKITEMETITEEEHSGDNDSDANGSEYSWYSTSDSEAGSRDPSPSRSRGSRDPSPARSTDSLGDLLSTSWDSTEKNNSSETPDDSNAADNSKTDNSKTDNSNQDNSNKGHLV